MGPSFERVPTHKLIERAHGYILGYSCIPLVKSQPIAVGNGGYKMPAVYERRTAVAATRPLVRCEPQAKAWVRDVVVKLRLCPFAEAVFNARRGVRYVVTPAETTDEVWREFLLEVDFLMDHDREVW